MRIRRVPQQHRVAPATALPKVGVQVELPPEPLHCGASTIARCDLSVPLTVTNHDATAVTVTSVELGRGDMRIKWEPEPRALLQGERFVLTLHGLWAGTQELVVRYRAGRAGPARSISRVVVVDHPERERRLAACRACKGDWGVHGISGTEGCNCRTRDAGNECRDGTDCEGECLFDHAEEVRAGSEHCSHGACSVTLRAVRLVGRCATYRATFGCHSYVPNGESKRAPRIGAVRAPYVCVD